MSGPPNPRKLRPRTAGWPGLLLAPLAALAALALGHALVTPACAWNTTLPLHASYLVATLIGAGASGMSLRAWRRAGGRSPLRDTGADDGRARDRDLFVALIGIAAGGYFTLVTVAQWATLASLSPCAQ